MKSGFFDANGAADQVIIWFRIPRVIARYAKYESLITIKDGPPNNTQLLRCI